MDVLDKKTLELLAEEAHKIWMEDKIHDGWKFGPKTDVEQKIHSCLLPYDQLSEADKELDRRFIRGIPRILKTAGLKIVTEE